MGVLPVWRKVCFAVGSSPVFITNTVIALFINVFLLEVALIEPRYISIILLVNKIWDAVTDLSIGVLVQKTDTRWGKMRPWILFSFPFACVSYFLLFYIPFPIGTDNRDRQYIQATDLAKLAYYFIMYCLFEGFQSCLYVPYTSLTMYVTTKQRERDNITALRMVFESVSVLVGVIIQGQFVSKSRCKDDTTVEQTIDISRQIKDYMGASAVVVSIYAFVSLVCFFGTREIKDKIVDGQVNLKTLLSSLKLVFTFKPFLWACAMFLCFNVAIQTIQANVLLFCTHVLKMGEDFPTFMMICLVVSIFSIPLWQLTLIRFGKKKTCGAGILILFCVLLSLAVIPEKSKTLFTIIMAISGLSVSASLLFPWSMLSDVADLYMLERKIRHDALLYSTYVFLFKLALGLGLAATQISLHYGGYVSGQCVQPESLSTTLRYVVTVGPALFAVLALVFLYFYPIDEDKRRETAAALEEYRSTVATEKLIKINETKENSTKISETTENLTKINQTTKNLTKMSETTENLTKISETTLWAHTN